MSDISKYMFKQINSLLDQKDNSGGKSRLARLRRGIGKAPGELPELWGEFLNGLPEDMLSKNGTPKYEEWAIYISLTLFALHQQGNKDSVHAEGISLGKAASKLMDDFSDEERQRVLRRFAPVITAKDMNELSYHLRSMIQLFSSKGIKLDYIKLAEDIYSFQFYDNRRKVQLKWGQDFYNSKGEEKE